MPCSNVLSFARRSPNTLISRSTSGWVLHQRSGWSTGNRRLIWSNSLSKESERFDHDKTITKQTNFRRHDHKYRDQQRLYATRSTVAQFREYRIRYKAKRRGLIVGILIGGVCIWLMLQFTDRIFHPPTKPLENRPKVIVLGSGWGALSFIREIDKNLYDVVVISPRNQFLFTPLLPEATLGSVDFSSITEPIRSFLARYNKSDLTYYEGICTDIDPKAQTVTCQISTERNQKPLKLKYDHLVVATGSGTDTLGVANVDKYCNQLRDIEDAKTIRNRIVNCFEAASLPGTPDNEKDKLLNFVVVGGTPTSVSFTSELHKLMNDLNKCYPSLSKFVRVTFVNAGEDHIRNTYDAKISHFYLERTLANIVRKFEGLKVIDGSVKTVSKDVLELDNGDKLPFGACVWLTGLAPSSLMLSIMAKNKAAQTNRNALLTDNFLQVKGFNNIYAIGNCATIDQRRILDKWENMFKELDRNNDGFVDEKEFATLATYAEQFPQLQQFVKETKILFEEGDVNKDGKLSMQEFKAIVAKLDSRLTSLPSTAQVAHQQGTYLGNTFNKYHKLPKEKEIRELFKSLDEDHSGSLDKNEVSKALNSLNLLYTKKDVEDFFKEADLDHNNLIDEDEFVNFVKNKQKAESTGDWKRLYNNILPFRYQHLGGFEYVGYDSKLTERGSQGKSILDGAGAWWMWNSILFSNMVSWRTRTQVVTNLITSKVFGRNITRN